MSSRVKRESAAAGVSGCFIPHSAFGTKLFQKALYTCIAPQLHTNSLNDLLCKRIAAMMDKCLEIPPGNLFELVGVSVQFMFKLPPWAAMHVIKTWINS